jgi:hypothetical protein
MGSKFTGTDALLLLGGAILALFLAVAIGYTITGVSNEAQAQSCDKADYAHVPYPDEYEFVCVGDTMEVWDAVTGEYVTSEQRCKDDELKAEDGTCVNEDYYYNGGETK